MGVTFKVVKKDWEVFMKKLIASIAVLAMALMVGRVFAEDMGGMKMEKKAAPAKTMKCEVVDVACYTKEGAMGEKHKECAVKCISGGGELALLSKGKLYVPVDADFKSAREQFVSKAGESVEVKGTVVSKGGVNYLKISGDEKKNAK
jgi:hypothetical protein